MFPFCDIWAWSRVTLATAHAYNKRLCLAHMFWCVCVSPELTVAISSSFSFDSVIRGHHIYKDIWTPNVGENLTCRAEPGNIHNPYAVAVQHHDVDPDSVLTIGHVPHCISSVCFLQRGTIVCEVIGNRQYSVDLPQGGLEVLCCLIFTASEEDVGKVRRLLDLAPKKEDTVESIPSLQPPPSKRCKLD